MSRGPGAALACCVLAAAAGGCGSSATKSSSSPSPSGASTHTVTSSLKPSGTPKYASPPSSAAVQSGSVQIAYRQISIRPDTLKVRVGSTITWTNYDSVEHNVTSQGGPQRLASGNFGEGATFAVKLSKPGIIHYLCTIHPTSMNGTIEVVR
ncbi:MAG: hypothetical protein QOI03_912 [Solirubrobacteraceae bacterium]|jgi:plastocyanin|nr:hypothetical protein [Solirubrobacteraceae bacterium]